MTSEVAEINPQFSIPLPWQQTVWQRLLDQYDVRQMAHAYLITGEEGIGKYQFVRAFASFLLCQSPTSHLACGECANCVLGATGFHPDIMLIQPEEGSRDIKINQIRAATSFIARTSHCGLGKVVILNHAHNLNNSAANGLLKTLEEPSNDTFIFLVTARADSLPATLRSRCQRLLMLTPDLGAATKWLQEQGIAPDNANALAIAAGRRPLHALALSATKSFEDTSAFLLALVAILQHKVPAQSVVSAAQKLGDTPAVECLLQTSSIVIRSLLVDATELGELHGELLQIVAGFSNRDLVIRKLLQFNLDAEKSLRQLQGSTNPNAQLMLESLLWQWSHLGTSGR